MFVYYTSKMLFYLYDNCDDTYSFHMFLCISVTMLPISHVYENTETGKYCVAFVN